MLCQTEAMVTKKLLVHDIQWQLVSKYKDIVWWNILLSWKTFAINIQILYFE